MIKKSDTSLQKEIVKFYTTLKHFVFNEYWDKDKYMEKIVLLKILIHDDDTIEFDWTFEDSTNEFKSQNVYIYIFHNYVSFKLGILNDSRNIEQQSENVYLIIPDINKDNQQQRFDKIFPVITLCGSTKFKDEFIEAQKRLSLNGNIVISVGLFGHSGDGEAWDGINKQMLDDMHKAKIRMSDKIYVINKDNYIGESTKKEIEYAKSLGKEVLYMFDHIE